MLDKILEQKKEELKTLTLPEQQCVNPVSFKQALNQPNQAMGLIAEVKKASPSKGVFVEDFHPVEIARSYELGGADAISVLTDQRFFQGHRDYLTAIKKEVNLPLLRKDFIIDPLQVVESIRIGADAILLIAAAMPARKLYELYQQAYEGGLECLVEVHNNEELESVLKVFTPEIIGVNNRKLQNFETKLSVTEAMAKNLPKDAVKVSESGIKTKADIDFLLSLGMNAVLVGETLMKAESPQAGIKQLFGEEIRS